MYLLREGRKSIKYYSREKAVDRFAYLISSFLKCDGAAELTGLAAKYSGFSIREKIRYCRALAKIMDWARAMEEISLISDENEQDMIESEGEMA